MKPLYLDHAATTPLSPRVKKAMEPYETEQYGNSASLHAMGVAAKEAVERARGTVARFLSARPDEIFFTSSATEANNLALLGYARAHKNEGNHLITTALEHASVLEPLRELEREGFRLTVLPVEEDGRLVPERIERARTDQTILASIGYANNEIGTIQPLKEFREVLKGKNVFFHTDAVQAAGVLSLDAAKLGVDAMSITGSKIYGPKGVGALYVKKGTELAPLMYGGGQQSGMRPGTENVAGAVGFAAALEIAQTMRERENARLMELRTRLLTELRKAFPDLLLNGPEQDRLPNNLNITLPNLDGEAVVIYASEAGVMLSTGSACSTVDPEPSHVLRAIGRSEEEANSSVRITLGRGTTKKDIASAVRTLAEVKAKLHASFS